MARLRALVFVLCSSFPGRQYPKETDGPNVESTGVDRLIDGWKTLLLASLQTISGTSSGITV
jgi:hypothetical protein